MSHPRELIERIAELLCVDYPKKDGYRYIFEKAIPGTRMMPDIVVVFGAEIVCAVEIGYTRPEKLTAYRTRHNIADVRWYDKSGVLHGGVDERSVRVGVTVEPAGEFFTYSVSEYVQCFECEGSEGPRRVPSNVAARYIRRFGDAYDVRQESALECEYQDVQTTVITDYARFWLPSFCDKCGRTWFATDETDNGLDVIGFSDQLASCRPRQLAESWGRRHQVTWNDAKSLVDAEYNLALLYQDGEPVTEGVGFDLKTTLHREMASARLRESGK